MNISSRIVRSRITRPVMVLLGVLLSTSRRLAAAVGSSGRVWGWARGLLASSLLAVAVVAGIADTASATQSVPGAYANIKLPL